MTKRRQDQETERQKNKKDSKIVTQHNRKTCKERQKDAYRQREGKNLLTNHTFKTMSGNLE